MVSAAPRRLCRRCGSGCRMAAAWSSSSNNPSSLTAVQQQLEQLAPRGLLVSLLLLVMVVAT